ncbi:MAG: succinate dehydrogenase, cytochrome b556 subunit [Pseudomonadota bacterium]
MTPRRPAPVYLNLFRISFPVGAVTSIAHRFAGVLLSLALPLLVYLLDLSLRDADGFARAAGLLQSSAFRFASVIIVWSLFHHLFAGIRYLLIDLEAGVGLRQARTSAWLVNGAGIGVAALYLWWVL